MKKILISLMLLFSTFLFGSVESDVEKMDYVLKVEKVQYEDNEYKAYVKFEQALSDNGTLGLNVIRVCRTLKMLQEKYPKGNWFYVDSVDEKNEMVITASIKSAKVNLKNKKTNVEICEEVLTNGNILLTPELRNKMMKFIEKGEIPVI
ncbi:hypothetical protein [uncultured Fusobacterium sp.]|uniref:hypothetical protein n=1 Tax=uncultured Fusobacterium sp. TaxID=159267 RepID=UPI0025FFCA16|nr:hypothetical protein [uncultured Fusobacterium sp.]